MSNDIYDFILELRAIRSFEDRPLTDDDLGAILEAARWTGSSKNRQDWSFVVVTEPDQREALATCGDFTRPLRSSAATIVIVQEPGGYEFDSGRVAQNMMLAAKAIGVASCPITLHRHEDAADVLGLPPDRKARYAVAFGYPGPDSGPTRMGGRRPTGELVHHQHYGRT
jgi:nitroreductase